MVMNELNIKGVLQFVLLYVRILIRFGVPKLNLHTLLIFRVLNKRQYCRKVEGLP